MDKKTKIRIKNMNQKTENKKPNILFIMSDHTNGASFKENSYCKTPNIDKLANDGIKFDRCYTTNAICSPSRASIMTGLYPSTHGMWDCTHTQRSNWVDVPAEKFTYFSNKLKDAGYHNGYFGKWHVEQSHKLEDFGWHEYNCKEAESIDFKPSGTEEITLKTDGYKDVTLMGVDEDKENLKHPAVEMGIDFLKKQAENPEKPFCCFVSTAEPHDPYYVPREFYDMYDVDEYPLSPSLRDKLKDKPEVIRRMSSVWKDLSDSEWKKINTAYCALITYLDSEFGRLIDTLKSEGLYDNTIIIFTSDHGDMQGAHGLHTKGLATSYEEVYNIPLIMRVPGTANGYSDKENLVSNVDLAPTLLDLCGADSIAEAQGRSFRKILDNNGKDDEWQNAYAEFFGQRFVYTQRIVWHKNWKYVFNPGGIDELYNLDNDPYERSNLSYNKEYEFIVIDMCKRMWNKIKEIGDDSLLNTDYATLRIAPIGPRTHN
jgi:arylsulfatase A-like enzyme